MNRQKNGSGLRQQLRNVPGLRTAYRKASALYHATFIRVLTPLRIQAAFLKGNRKLHFGSGATSFPGFINADIYTGDIYINLLKRLPFKDNSLTHIYSHHVFEHFDLRQAEQLLKELYRVLESGGVLRLVMPDLDIISDRKKMDDLGCTAYYYNCSSKRGNYDDKFVIAFNEMLHQDGEHKFIYNYSFARELLATSGFKLIESFEHGSSPHPAFAGLDPHSGACVAKVSMAIEAVK